MSSQNATDLTRPSARRRMPPLSSCGPFAPMSAKRSPVATFMMNHSPQSHPAESDTSSSHSVPSPSSSMPNAISTLFDVVALNAIKNEYLRTPCVNEGIDTLVTTSVSRNSTGGNKGATPLLRAAFAVFLVRQAVDRRVQRSFHGWHAGIIT